MLSTVAENEQGRWAFRLNPTNFTDYATFHAPKREWKSVAIRPLPKHTAVPEEVYVRGDDLIARFAQTKDDAFAFQLNWRALDKSASVDSAIELWVSIQTDLLDSSPELEICSHGGDGSWEIHNHAELLIDSSTAKADSRSDSPAALVLTESNASYVWLIEPTDQRHVELLTSSSDCIQRIKLFDHFMEKGVIRRARMRFLASSEQLDLQQIRSAYREFAESPLPLTA
jgi:hypothetical protein